jgi:hypothetical protein
MRERDQQQAGDGQGSDYEREPSQKNRHVQRSF